MRQRRPPTLKLADAARAKIACLLSLDASSERAERAVREVEELLGIFTAVQMHRGTQKLSKRGAPTSDALMELVRLLRRVFRRRYRGRRLGRRREALCSFSARRKNRSCDSYTSLSAPTGYGIEDANHC